MAQPHRLLLPDGDDAHHLAQPIHLRRLGHLAPLAQRVLQLVRVVEVIDDRDLPAARDHHDVRDARPHRLLDHQLDRRNVDDRQHLLRDRLRGRQEPRAQPGRRNHRLVHLLRHDSRAP
jgi:hypothetical protein